MATKGELLADWHAQNNVKPSQLYCAVVHKGIRGLFSVKQGWNRAARRVLSLILACSSQDRERLARFVQCQTCQRSSAERVGPGRDSPQLVALYDIMRLFVKPCNDLELIRSSVLGCLCPSLPASKVSWAAVKFGGVPGWRASPAGGEITDPLRVAVVYVHGGGLCSGDASCFQGILSRLADRLKRPVWFPHYRLCPEHTKEEATEDVLRFLDAMVKEPHNGLCGEDLRFVLVADSAGAYLAHAACQDARLFQTTTSQGDVGSDSAAGRVLDLCLFSPMLGLVDLEDGRLAEGAAFGSGRATMDALDSVDPIAPRRQLGWCYQQAKICPPERVLKGPGPYAANKVLVVCALSELLYADSVVYADTLKKRMPHIEVERRFRDGKHLHASLLMAGLGVPEIELELDGLARRVERRTEELCAGQLRV